SPEGPPSATSRSASSRAVASAAGYTIALDDDGRVAGALEQRAAESGQAEPSAGRASVRTTFRARAARNPAVSAGTAAPRPGPLSGRSRRYVRFHGSATGVSPGRRLA